MKVVQRRPPSLNPLAVMTVLLLGVGTTLSLVEAQDPTTTTTNAATTTTPIPFTEEECSSWLTGILNSDTDNSGGLSEEEYFAFLTSIDSHPYIEEYFDQYEGIENGESSDENNQNSQDNGVANNGEFGELGEFAALPWIFRLIHKTLACRCTSLGHGEKCCEGDDAELLLDGFSSPDEGVNGEGGRSEAEKEYAFDVCYQIGYALEKMIESPSPTGSPVESPETTVATVATVASVTTSASGMGDGAPSGVEFSIVASVIDYLIEGVDLPTSVQNVLDSLSDSDGEGFLRAEYIQSNDGGNDVLEEIQTGFWTLVANMFVRLGGDMPESAERIGRLDGMRVEDIECPTGLIYAPPQAPCLQFTFTLEPTPEVAHVISPSRLSATRSGDQRDERDERQEGEEPGLFEDTYFVKRIKSAINVDGRLYLNIVERNPNTVVKGVGNPGGGIDIRGYDAPPPPPPPPQKETEETELNTDVDVTTANTPLVNVRETEESSGIPGGVIFVIIFILVAIPITILLINRKREEEKRVRAFAGRPLSEKSMKDLESGVTGGTSTRWEQGAAAAGMSAVNGEEEKVEEDVELGKEPDFPVEAVEEAVPAAAAAGVVASSKKSPSPGVSFAEEPVILNPEEEDDSSDTSSVVSQEEDPSKGGFVNDDPDEQRLSAAGSTLAAMGVASTVVASMGDGGSPRAAAAAAERTNVGEGNEAPVVDIKAKIASTLTLMGVDSEVVASIGDGTVPTAAVAAARSNIAEGEEEVRNTGSTEGTRSTEATEFIGDINEAPANEPSMDEIKAQITSLVEQTTPGKSAEELLAAYKGREQELLSHLQRFSQTKLGSGS